jgi:hypothetical protein
MPVIEISDQKLNSLLYPGNTTKIFATYQPWFDPTTNKHHENTPKLVVPYSCMDPVWVDGILDKWQMMGIEGFCANWYGDYSTFVDNATYLMFQRAAMRGIWGCLQFDKNVFKYKHHTTYSNLQEMKYQLDFLNKKYFNLSNYHRMKDGRKMILEFCESQLAGHWAEVVAYNPQLAWMSENANAEKIKAGAGAYGWNPTKSPLSASAAFYATRKSYPGKIWIGEIYKGFNDYNPANPSQSIWPGQGAVRINPENNGQTWLDSFAAINNAFSTTEQLLYALLVTWNDHEEGTGVEFGIEYSVQPSLTVSSGQVQVQLLASNWHIIQRVDAYISTPTSLEPVVVKSIDISKPIDLTDNTDPGDYSVFIKVVGKAGCRNYNSVPVTATLKPPVSAVWVP